MYKGDPDSASPYFYLMTMNPKSCGPESIPSCFDGVLSATIKQHNNAVAINKNVLVVYVYINKDINKW